MSYQFIRVESHDNGVIARIVLNRPESRNAQNRGLLVELDTALLAAEQDDRVRVVILAGAGPSFSAGHDLGTEQGTRERTPGPDAHPTISINGGTRVGGEKTMLQEWHYYFENVRRWRDLRKITIAEVQGNVISAGLMLAWACDLIVAAEGTRFSDVVGSRMGMSGVEYFAHPWELGPRKAKELLLTGDYLDAADALALGMVSKVFPADQLTELTLQFARRIAAVPTMGALLIKESVNQAVDSMGFTNALRSAFSIHQLNHQHWAHVHQDHFHAARPDDLDSGLVGEKQKRADPSCP